jgi:hypothetical protein
MKLKYRLGITTLVVVLMIIMTAKVGLVQQSSPASAAIWASPSLQRIGDTQKLDLPKNIQLSAARGEYESFQIGIHSEQQNLTNVNVSVSDLVGQDNQVIPKSNFTLYREHYVPVTNSSPKEVNATNLPEPPGLYPDALIPFVNPETGADLTGAELDAVPFQLASGKTQPIWVDILVPRDAKPGDYKATYTVTSDQGKFDGEVSLKVWNFELPLKPSMKSSFLVWESTNKNTFVELLKHKIMPGADIPPDMQRELIDKWGLNAVKLPFFTGGNVYDCRVDPAPSVEDMQAAAKEVQQDVFKYVQSLDELDNCTGLDDEIREWATNIKKAGLTNVAVLTPTPELYSPNYFGNSPAIDIWVILPRMYEEFPERVAEILKNGEKVWFYNTLSQEEYAPKFLMDFTPINFRIPFGFISKSLGLSGAFYWRVDLWQGNPWKDEQKVFQNNAYYPYEGLLLYPGQQVGVNGVVPSMRLKWIRDGVEDYEYIEKLASLGRVDKALEISRSVAPNWKTWTREANVLFEGRQKLAEEIVK